jgi:hypothetical protein
MLLNGLTAHIQIVIMRAGWKQFRLAPRILSHSNSPVYKETRRLHLNQCCQLYGCTVLLGGVRSDVNFSSKRVGDNCIGICQAIIVKRTECMSAPHIRRRDEEGLIRSGTSIHRFCGRVLQKNYVCGKIIDVGPI